MSITTLTSGRRFHRTALATAVGIIASVSLGTTADAGFDPSPVLPGLPPVVTPLCERDPAPDLCFADYSAHASSFGAWDSWRDGGPATAFYVTIRNDGLVDPGSVWSTVSIDQYEIIDIEPVWGDWNVTSSPVASAGTDAVWTIHHRDGLGPDEFTTFRVWVGSWDAVDLAVHANHHGGVETFGDASPSAYRQPERVLDNNLAFTFG